MTATQAREKRVAVERIVGFAKRYGEDALNLACHAAFPLVLTPDLLYQIWANFVTQAPWTGVARVLLSPLCREVGFEMYEMDLAVRNLLLRELQEQFGKQRFEELAEFLQEYVLQRLNSEDPDIQDIAQAQNWTALAYTKPGEAARELAQLLVERLQQQDKAEVFRLTSLVETFAQPLIEAGFQPLLVYAGGIKSYVRGDLERAGELFDRLPKQGRLVSAGGIIVPIPGELLPESEVEALPTPVAIESQLNFIQALLASPREEGRNLLKANQALMTESFLMTIKQVAAIMVEEGNEESANWLRDLAAEVSENLDETSSYLQLIREVLQATSESKGDPSVVYPLLQQNLDKLDGNFAQIMQAWATQTLSEVEEDRAFRIAADIGNFANLITDFPLGFRADHIEIGILGYEISLTVFTSEKLPEMWAMTQNNLGNAYSDRIRGERAENLETAIACYEAALQVYTPEAFPQDWAMTQNNLGAAYSDRIRGERGENLERAIACYQAALQVRTPEAFPQNWAMTQNNLGNAYLYGIRGERAENLERAIACYEAALQVYTPEAFPEQWASTLNNLGTAYNNRIRGERDENLERAIACYEAALQVYTPEAFPQNWASTQNNLGTAYNNRIRGERDENLERAIACYAAALQVYTPEAFPQNWASTQNNLGTAYTQRIRGERSENLERAIACYAAALQVYTPEAFPQNWASIQNNLGTAYTQRIRGERSENLERAIACYEAALQVYTPEAFPQNWASTQNNLGTAYTQRIRGERSENLEWAIACYEAALQVYTPEAFPQTNAETLFNLGVAYQSYSDLERAYNVFMEAVNTVDQIRLETTSSYEAKQKQSEEWNKLYQCLVEVCLDLQNSTAALEFVERSKAQNLTELLASGDLYLREIRDKPIAFTTIQALLDNETAIIEWYILNDIFVAFIITRVNPVPIVWRSSTEDLEALTNLSGEYFSQYYMTDNSEWQSQLLSHLDRLGKIIHINEIISMLPSQCDRLVLIPHRYLHLFPISALPLDRNGTEAYVLDLFPQGVQYAPSCQILEMIQWRSRQNFDNLFAIENPTADIPFTDIEVQAISRYFKSHTILARQEATKASLSTFLEELQSAHCLHISAHSYFNFQSPLQSSIILANSTLPLSEQLESTRSFRFKVRVESGDRPSKPPLVDLDKCLTLAEIYRMNLSQCSLVTLSACDTAIVDISSQSDDYISFQGAFLSAGANSVVGSLWSPNDRSTAFLMIKFYANLFQGLTVSMALTQAQLWLREVTTDELQDWIKYSNNLIGMELPENLLEWYHPTEKPFSNPFHWAAFILTGAII